jgi:hypothetical protein
MFSKLNSAARRVPTAILLAAALAGIASSAFTALLYLQRASNPRSMTTNPLGNAGNAAAGSHAGSDIRQTVIWKRGPRTDGQHGHRRGTKPTTRGSASPSRAQRGTAAVASEATTSNQPVYRPQRYEAATAPPTDNQSSQSSQRDEAAPVHSTASTTPTTTATPASSEAPAASTTAPPPRPAESTINICSGNTTNNNVNNNTGDGTATAAQGGDCSSNTVIVSGNE